MKFLLDTASFCGGFRTARFFPHRRASWTAIPPAVAMLEWHHRDPFDRILIAQARSENLVLLTADGALSAYGQLVRVAG